MPLPNLQPCYQCTAKCKRTGERCKNFAAYGMRVCRYHGAKKPASIVRGEKHGRYVHGQGTQEMKAAQREEMKELSALKVCLKKADLIK